MAASSSARVGRPSLSPRCVIWIEPITVPRRAASLSESPSATAESTPAAKPSPAPTVSTIFFTGNAGTVPLSPPVDQYAPSAPSLTITLSTPRSW